VTNCCATRRRARSREKLVHDQRQPVVKTESVERRVSQPRHKTRSGCWDGRESRREIVPWLFVERIKIDLPSVIVEQRIRNEFHVGKIGKKLE